jgi:hypothetical protein
MLIRQDDLGDGKKGSISILKPNNCTEKEKERPASIALRIDLQLALTD